MTTQISGDTGVSQVQGGVGGVVNAGPAFSVSTSASQSVTDGVWAKLTNLSVEGFDTNNAFSASRFTPQTAGYYQINAFLAGTASGSTMSNIGVAVYKNGVNYAAVAPSIVGGGSQSASIGCIVYLNGTTDYVELYGRVSGGTGGQTIGSATMSGSLVRAG
jgi:hypothetical protein